MSRTAVPAIKFDFFRQCDIKLSSFCSVALQDYRIEVRDETEIHVIDLLKTTLKEV